MTSILLRTGSPSFAGRTEVDALRMPGPSRRASCSAGGPRSGIAALGKGSVIRAAQRSLRLIVWIPRDVGSFVERIEPIRVVALQLEVKDGSVLADPFGPDRLRNHDEPVLKAPANQDLRVRPIVLRSNFHDNAVRQAASPGEGAVGL